MDTDKPSQHRQRRGKRDAVSDHFKSHTFSSKSIDPSNNENNMSSKEEQVTKSSKPKPHHRTGKRKTTSSASGGGVEALIPSLIGVGILIFSVMAQQGFRDDPLWRVLTWAQPIAWFVSKPNPNR